MSQDKPHNLPDRYVLTDQIKNKTANVYFYNKTIVIVEVHEGVTLSYRTGLSILFQTIGILRNRNWVYISNRVNSYSVVPTDYNILHKIPTLQALAIVTNEDGGRLKPHVEELFCKKPFNLFDDLESAAKWAEKSLMQQKVG